MLKDPINKEAYHIVKKLQKTKSQEKIIDSLSLTLRKNVIIRAFLNSVPTKLTYTEMDYLILCFPGQYIRELDFEKEENLIKFISNNKNKYRFTIYTDCDKGYNFKGISISPYWKWRTCNRYHNCLIYLDSSHLKLNINAKNLI